VGEAYAIDCYELTINGERRAVEGAPDTPLLDVLRGDLGLVGSRFGCGMGLCGACFVLLEGHPAPACDTPLWAAAGKAVTTVEGLRDHPLLDAFIAEQAAQCGYCVSGVLVSATALLARDPAPDERAVVEALDRHLCRCGAHGRMVRAVLRAAGA
jgi:nicotinate dehydrogenase subunit A